MNASEGASDARIILESSEIPIPQIRRITEPLIPRAAPILHRLQPLRRQLLLQVLLPL